MPSSSHLLLCHPISCSGRLHLSSRLPPPLVSRSHHCLSTVALRHSSAGQRHQTLPLFCCQSCCRITFCLQPSSLLVCRCCTLLWLIVKLLCASHRHQTNPFHLLSKLCRVASHQQALSPCWLCPLCCHLILFLRHCQLLRGFNNDGSSTLVLPEQRQLKRNGVNVGGCLHGRVSPLFAAKKTTLLLCCPPSASLAFSPPPLVLLSASLSPCPSPPPPPLVMLSTACLLRGKIATTLSLCPPSPPAHALLTVHCPLLLPPAQGHCLQLMWLSG